MSVRKNTNISQNGRFITEMLTDPEIDVFDFNTSFGEVIKIGSDISVYLEDATEGVYLVVSESDKVTKKLIKHGTPGAQGIPGPKGDSYELTTEDMQEIAGIVSESIQDDSDVFWVTVTNDLINPISSDKTVSEIYQAFRENKSILCKYNMDGVIWTLLPVGIWYSTSLFYSFFGDGFFTLTITENSVQESLIPLVSPDDIPTVPTNVSAFNNDAGFIKNSEIPDLVQEAGILTKEDTPQIIKSTLEITRELLCEKSDTPNVEVLSERTLAINLDGIMLVTDEVPMFIEGDTYSVSWNGVEYQCVAEELTLFNAIPGYCLGNAEYAKDESTTIVEPFVIFRPNDSANREFSLAIFPIDGSHEATVSILGAGYVIRDEYLPDDFASSGTGSGCVAQDTPPEDTSVLWVDTSDNEEPVIIDDEYINRLIDAKLGVIENGSY